MSSQLSLSGTAVARLLEAVRTRLMRESVEPTPAAVAAAVRAEDTTLGDAEVLALSRLLRADLTGAGPLEPLLAAPDITDILVNGPHEIWVRSEERRVGEERRGWCGAETEMRRSA